MINKVQALITEIDRADRTRRTMVKRLRKQGDIFSRAKKVLREQGIRPYVKRAKVKTVARRSPSKITQKDVEARV